MSSPSKVVAYAGLGVVAPVAVLYIFGYRATWPRVRSVCVAAWRTSAQTMSREVGNWRNELTVGEALEAWMWGSGR